MNQAYVRDIFSEAGSAPTLGTAGWLANQIGGRIAPTRTAPPIVLSPADFEESSILESL